MIVRIDTKNYSTGRYRSRVLTFNSETHLNNYLNVCYKNEIRSKVIGFEVLES
jgi:hypothetical protein